MDDCCRICLDSTSFPADPLVRRCGCTSGFFHDSCFIEWARRRDTLKCEVCNSRFMGVSVEVRKVRLFSALGPAYACLTMQGGLVIFLLAISSALSRLQECHDTYNYTITGTGCNVYSPYAFLSTCVSTATAFTTVLFVAWGWGICVKPREMGLIMETNVRDIILADSPREENGEEREGDEGEGATGSSGYDSSSCGLDTDITIDDSDTSEDA